jgi:hypothetical protein
MSPRRSRCFAPLLAASLSALLSACASSGDAPGAAVLSDPALAAKPSTAGATNETQAQPAKPAARAELPKVAARPELAKSAATRAEPPKTAARAEPPKTAARQEPAKAAVREPAETSTGAEGEDSMAQLKRMVDGTNRTWVGRAEPPEQFAEGTRLFAYRALRPKLNCRELGLALTEIDSSSKRLQDPASAVSPERVERVTALAADVAGELKSERAGRCSSTGTRTSAAGAEPARSR